MAGFSTQAGKNGQASSRSGISSLSTLALSFAVGTLLALSVGTASAADSTDRIIPPTPAEVAMLRGLLALQHPALLKGATAQPVVTAPTVATEPAQQLGNAPAAVEGNAAQSKLNVAFRASLERSMAAVGYTGAPL